MDGINLFIPEQWEEYKKIRLLSLKNESKAFGSSYEQELNFSDQRWKERLLDKNSLTLYCYEEDVIVGTARSKITNDRADIIGVYISPNSRGKGLSKKMLIFLIQKLTNLNVNTFYLSVNKLQIPAINLYLKIGFKIIGEEKTKMGDGIIYDEYLMEYKLI
ncbi:acyl-CoA N-acyltransferase [Cunninghamella echinulata]|nr:acyl-CoA N-acyltransferase [Cunninghamella echinulata]